MTPYEIVTKLIGPIQPTGDHGVDTKHLENMRNMTELVGALLDNVRKAARASNSKEASVRAIGLHARDFVDDVSTNYQPEGD